MRLTLCAVVRGKRYQTFQVELYELEELGEATRAAEKSGGRIYTWHTTGKYNWLELRPSIVDAVGLVVLPNHLPEYMNMPNDPPEALDRARFLSELWTRLWSKGQYGKRI